MDKFRTIDSFFFFKKMKIVIQKIIHFWVLMLKRQLPITIFNSTLLFITHIEL